MNNEFKARFYLEELYNMHLNDKQGDFSSDIIINEEQISVFVHKFLNSSVDMEIHTQTYRNLYKYDGDSSKPFDMDKLIFITANEISTMD